MGFSLQLWHKFRHQFDGSGGGESVHLRCRGWGLLAVLLIVLQIAATITVKAVFAMPNG